jgi:hypothetical protein
MEKHRRTIQEILFAYGSEKQIERIIEECSELILALQKYKTHITKATPEEIENLENNVESEIADVVIMCEQAQEIFYRDRVQQLVTEKLNRQKERLKKRAEEEDKKPACKCKTESDLVSCFKYCQAKEYFYSK